MKRSTERILTTHVGSLVRPPAILEGMKARVLKQPYDQERFARDIRQGIRDVVGSRPKSASTFPVTVSSAVRDFRRISANA